MGLGLFKSFFPDGLPARRVRSGPTFTMICEHFVGWGEFDLQVKIKFIKLSVDGGTLQNCGCQNYEILMKK